MTGVSGSGKSTLVNEILYRALARLLYYGQLGEGVDREIRDRLQRMVQARDAETTPLRDPEHYQYDFDLPDIAEVWRRGSVIASWLLDLTAAALLKEPTLSGFGGRVSDSGEGRWTIKAAIDEAVPAHVLSAALYERFSSRGSSVRWRTNSADVV